MEVGTAGPWGVEKSIDRDRPLLYLRPIRSPSGQGVALTRLPIQKGFDDYLSG